MTARGPGLLRKLFRAVGRVPELRRAILGTQPDVVIAFGDQINVLLLAMFGFSRIPVVATEHVDPGHFQLGWPWRVLRRVLYPRALSLVSVSSGVDRCFDWLPASRRAVIHNPVEIPRAGDGDPVAFRAGDGGDYIVAVGRLVHQKGFDRLIDCFAVVLRGFPAWHLVLLGEGPEEQQLREQTRILGISDRVHFLGVLRDPFPVMRGAAFLTMASRFEGFGNVLIEAMACGLPVVSFDCRSGPGEIVRDGVCGRLVPADDTAALCAAMEELMGDAALRERMAVAAAAEAERYRLDAVVARWEDAVLGRLRR